MYKNYVFDFYGTLVDIHTDEWKDYLWQRTAEFYTLNGAFYSLWELKDRYFKFVEEESQAVHQKHPDYTDIDIKIEKVFRRLYEEKGIKADDALVEKTARRFRNTSREYIRLYPGIEQLLTDLKKVGKVYLLTNAQRAFTWDELEIVGIRDLFDGIIISSDEECCKPDKAFYQTIIDRYGLDPSETIMVGNDPVTDIKGAQGVGFDTLYIHSNISPAINYNSGATYFIPDGNTLKMKDYLL